MKPQLMAALLAVGAFASGCSGPSGDGGLDGTGTDEPGPSDPATPSDPDAEGLPAVERPFLDFAGCSEANILVPLPSDAFDSGPLVIKKTDPLGETITIIFTAMACDTLDASGRAVAKPAGIYGMAAVEPHPDLKIDGVTSYYWLGFAATEHPEIRSVLGARGVDVEKAKLTLRFDQLAGNPKARGTLEGVIDDFRVSAETFMAGSAANGPAGSLGLYTFSKVNNTVSLWVHRVNFTAYKSYDKGVALVTPAFLPLPQVVEMPQPVQSYHNIDYGARFDFDVGLVET